MAYLVRGLKSGAVLELELPARDAGDAGAQAAALGLAVLSVRRANWALPRARERFPLLLFSQELLALLQSGIALVEAIVTLLEKEAKPSVRRTLEALLARLREGHSLSAAMQESNDAFPRLYVATIKASERTGDLPEALGRYIQYQGQVDVLRRKILASALYPALLLGIGTLVTLFLVGYVVPRFGQIYEDMGNGLPWLSWALLRCGQFIEQHAVAAGATALAALWFGARWLARPESVPHLLSLVARVPSCGARIRLYQLARFYRTLGMLLRGGVPIVTALGMVEGLMASALRQSLQRASQAVSEGLPISQAMEMHGLTTPVALRMLRVGERSGRMGEMMERIAAFYDDDMARWVDWFTRLFEPLLMLFMGLVIGGVVLLLYLPVFELAGSIK